MAIVANFFGSVLKSIPVLLAKVGTILLLVFTFGMLAGYGIAALDISPIVFFIPVAAMLVMWYRLDEGVFVLLLLAVLFFLFPDLLNGFFSAIL